MTTDSTPYTIEHDAVGRVTEGAGSTYVYGPRGRLMRATGTIAPIVREEYLYDADGRLAHVLNGKSRTLVHDGEELIAAIDDQGLPIWESVPGAFTNQVLEYQRENLERMIPVTDHRHSIVGWWNATLRQMDTTIEYTPLGRLQIFGADGSVICTEEGIGADCARIVPRFGFGSAYHTEFTGLVYMRNRWYSPKLGQFLTHDPLGYVDGYNPWAYAVFDPINFWDPYGLCVNSGKYGCFDRHIRSEAHRPVTDAEWSKVQTALAEIDATGVDLSLQKCRAAACLMC